MSNRKVFKYPLGPEGRVRLTVPDYFRPVLAGVQDGQFMLWAEVAGEPACEREFVVVGTGHTIPKGAAHVGSFQDAPYVWHVYEIDPPYGCPRLTT